MIRIKAVYIGNGAEAFIENSFVNGINVIYSDDNNRGKTILMQSAMYTLGASPTFPEKFLYREYLYVVDLDVDGRPVSILRSRNTFAVLDDDELSTFSNVEEFTRYWGEHITTLPDIVKDGHLTSVGLDLYTQMFFVGQDDNSSSRINASRFNKNDFKEMLYSLADLDWRELSNAEVNALKTRRAELNGRKKTLLKEAGALRERGTAMALVSATTDRKEFDELQKSLEAAKDATTDLRKKRSRLLAKKTKSQMVLDELRSLRIDTPVGQLSCLDCGSHRIGYSMAHSDMIFDVSTAEMRQQIINSLNERIDATTAELDGVERELREAQRKLASLLEESKDYSLADIVACRDDFLDEREIDVELHQIQDELDEIKDKLEADKALTTELAQDRKEFMDSILSKMNHARTTISGNTDDPPYEQLFGTTANVFSGSDRTVYFASRCYALALAVEHGMPILIDSFRADDLSTSRENRLLELLGRLDNQMILTTTIKEQEGGQKYEEDSRVHAINYSTHEERKMLKPDYNEDFEKKVAEFGVVLT